MVMIYQCCVFSLLHVPKRSRIQPKHHLLNCNIASWTKVREKKEQTKQIKIKKRVKRNTLSCFCKYSKKYATCTLWLHDLRPKEKIKNLQVWTKEKWDQLRQCNQTCRDTVFCGDIMAIITGRGCNNVSHLLMSIISKLTAMDV